MVTAAERAALAQERLEAEQEAQEQERLDAALAAQERLDAALDALAAQHAPGPLTKRVESAIDETMDEALTAFGAVLGGNMARSKGIRTAIERGFEAIRAERAAARSQRV